MLGIDQPDDHSEERVEAADILLRLSEHRPEHPELHSHFIENLAVVSYKFFAVAIEQAGPPSRWALSFVAVSRPRLLVGHFQKEQKRDLRGVSHVETPIIVGHGQSPILCR